MPMAGATRPGGFLGPVDCRACAPGVVAAVSEALQHGTTFGAPAEAEGRSRSAWSASYPAVELVRFVSSGTEATMSAIRLARACTARDRS